MEQGLVHLERIARIKEPEDSKSKAHYYDGFLVLSRYGTDATTHIFSKHAV